MNRLERAAVAVVVLAAALGAGAVALSSRSGGTDPVPSAGRCGDVVTEPLDSRSLQHVFPGAPPPAFADAHPTSGPHTPGVERAGVQPETLSPELQVGLLEEGKVLLQHQGLDDQARARLESLAGPDVVVAPGEGLPDSLLATAWTAKLRCDGVEVEAVRRFIQRYEGVGFG